jgi:hypothetical protein
VDDQREPIHILWPGWTSDGKHRCLQLGAVSAEERHRFLCHRLDDVVDVNWFVTGM